VPPRRARSPHGRRRRLQGRDGEGAPPRREPAEDGGPPPPEPEDPGGQPLEERVPRQHVPRAEEPAQRDHRLRGAHPRRPRRTGAAAAARVPGRGPRELAPPPPPRERHPRPGEDRGREARPPPRAPRPENARRGDLPGPPLARPREEDPN